MWTYIVSNARIPGPASGTAYCSFNLNAVLWNGSGTAGVDDLGRAGNLPLPWLAIAPTDGAPQFKVFAGNGAPGAIALAPLLDRQAVPFVRPNGTEAAWERLQSLLASLWQRRIAEHAEFPAIESVVTEKPGEDPATVEISGGNWSGQIASLSQYGWPLAHALRLAAWVPVSAAELAGNAWFAVIPASLKWTADFVATPDLQAATLENGEWVVPYVADNVPVLQLRVQIAAVAIAANDPLAKPFLPPIPAPRPLWRNWRRDLPLRAGALIDLLPWWELRRRATNRATNKPTLLRLLDEALCLAHHRSGAGLVGGTADPVAVEVLTLVASGGVDAARSLVARFLKTPIPLPTLAQWRANFADALAAAPDYEVLLAWLLCDPTKPEIPANRKLVEPADFEAELQLLIGQLGESLADEAVLLRLFLGEWQRLHDGAEDPLFELAGIELAADPDLRPAARPANRALLAERLHQALAASGRGLALRLGDGMTRRWLIKAEDRLGHARADLDANSAADPGSSKQAARAVFVDVLRAYANAAWSTPADGFLRPPEPKVLDLGIPDTGSAAAAGAAGAEPTAFSAALEDLTGDAANYQPPAARTVHPLPVPLPTITEQDLHQLSGVAVFSRRVDGDRATDWHCPTIGDLLLRERTTGEPVEYLLASSVLVPWQLAASDGIVQRWVEYRSRPLTVDPLEAEAGETKVLGKATDEQPPDAGFTLRHLQMAERDTAGFGPLTSLRYRDESVRYQFLFSAVHNTGALPAALQAPDNPGRLTPVAQLTNVAKDEPAAIDPAGRFSQPYRRRVGVGPVRPIRPPSPTVSFGKQAPLPFTLPAVPAGVLPLANDLDAVNTGNVPASSSTLEAERASFSTLLLHDGLRSVEFALRPPATDFDNWRFWVRGGWRDAAPGSAFDDHIRSLEGSVQFRLLSLGEVASAEAGANAPAIDAESPAQILDDPAVAGVVIQVRALYADPRQPAAAPPSARFVPVTTKTGRAPGDWPTAPDEGDEQLVFEFVRHVCGAAGNATRIRIERAVDPASAADGNTIVIRVPSGVVWELLVSPCVHTRDRDRFDAGWSPFASSGTEAWSDGQHVEVVSARQIWRVETPPQSPAMPEPEQVWAALRLSSTVDAGGAATTSSGVRLRAELCPWAAGDAPSAALRHAWAMVGHVDTWLQPWRWNGLPQDSEGLLAAAIPGADLDAGNLQRAVTAEVAAFADRDDGDALLHESRVNFAPWRTSQGMDAPCAPLLTIRGEREPFARYYRARISLASRYRGLPDIDKDIDAMVASAHAWQATAQREGAAAVTARTAYRRLLVRGRHVESPPLPRVVFVVPMLVRSPGSRPGFLAILRESVQSPFAKLQARVTTAVTQWTDPSTGKVPRQVEIAPDPIGTAHAMPDGIAAPVWTGKMIGLTHEREAASPLFASGAAWFEPTPGDALPEQLLAHDFFAKVAFRWRVDRGSLETVDGRELAADPEGPETSPWQVRLLAPFDELPQHGAEGPVPIAELRFRVAARELSFERVDDRGRPLHPCVPMPPRLDTEPGPLEPILLFVAEAAVPDLLAAAPSPLAIGVWVLPAQGEGGAAPKPKLLFPATIPSDGMPTARNGHFLLLHSSRPIPLLDPPQSSAPGPSTLASWDDLLVHLFGNDSEVGTNHAAEARSMIVRMSAPITAESPASKSEE